MEEELDLNVIKATQISLGKYVKRPPLSEKLLKKPPFRFLHDIVTSVLKSKGFFEGLFDENELISENVKDRESKILFLTKVISVITLTTGQTLSIKPSKIVAGQEPGKTNELLQCLAKALDRNLSSDEAVKKYKAGVNISSRADKKIKEPVKSIKKNIETKKLTSKSTEKLVNSEKDVNKSRQKENTVLKKESPPKKAVPKVSSKKSSGKSNPETKQNVTVEEKKVEAKNLKIENETENRGDDSETIFINEEGIRPSLVPSNDESILHAAVDLQDKLMPSIDNVIDTETISNYNDKQAPDNFNTNLNQEQEKTEEEIKKEKDAELNNDVLINLDIKGVNVDMERNKKEEINNDTISSKNKLEEYYNSSSTINAQENKAVDYSITRPLSTRPSSSRPGAPRLKDKSENILPDSDNVLVGKVNIISENTLHEEEKDTSIVIVTQETDELQGIQGNRKLNSLSENQNSHLVQQILDSQKEFSHVSGKTEIEWQYGAQKTQDIFIQEMEHLGYSVQALSRVANPLGKLLDHIQEDVEVMRQELQQWTKTYEDTSKDLQRQKSAHEESLLPFRVKIKQLTTDIEEKREKITDLKISIHKNSSRIEKLLASGNVQ